MLAGLEKGTGYYLQNHLFLTKMALLALILLLEIRPMITLIRWRKTMSLGETPDTGAAPLLARISFVQAWLVVLMVLAQTFLLRTRLGIEREQLRLEFHRVAVEATHLPGMLDEEIAKQQRDREMVSRESAFR